MVVLGLPRGGVPVAYEVARALHAPLDVLVVRKLGAPSQPELALGAVASGGTVVRNEEIVRALGVDEATLDRIVASQLEIVTKLDRSYRGDRPRVPVAGRTVIVVDDGLATGATMRAALRALRTESAEVLIAAAPVGPDDIGAVLADAADRVELVATPADFVAVGLWYDDFRQVDDDEVRTLLTP